jgi:nicotinamide mononucleotide transporter
VAGMIVWYRNRENKEKNKSIIVKVEKLSKKEKLIYIAPVVIIYLVVSYLLGTYANTSVPYIDSLVATLSLFANYLLVRRKVESWWIWIAADIIYIGLFISMGLYVSSALYFILLLISFKGLIDWKIALKKQS